MPVVMFLFLACGDREARTPPPEPVELEAADAVAAADFDGDGVDEMLFATGSQLRWPGGTQDLGGQVQVVTRGDVDGDGREEAILGTGMGRDFRDAPARVWAVGAAGARVLWERSGERNQVTALEVVDGRLWLAAFGAGQVVEGGWLADGQLGPGPGGRLSTARLAPSQLPVGDAVILGRVYGDTPRSDGDLRVRRGDEERVLPSLRGVRSLEVADLDDDGAPEVLVGDGWHYAYGQQAVGRVLLLRGPDWSEGRVIAHFGDEYSARELAVVGDDILVTGTRRVHLLRRDALGWADVVLGPVDETHNAVPVRTPAGPAALIAGNPSRLVHFPR